MGLSTITLDGQQVTLVDVPLVNLRRGNGEVQSLRRGGRSLQWKFDDPAGVVPSGFSSKKQVQRWPGADLLSGTLSLPVMRRADADEWIAFLLALRGQSNGFRLWDPTRRSPRGEPQRSVPVVDGTDDAKNLPGASTLVTRGWNGAGRLLEANDWVGVGYRAYRNLFPVIAVNGAATLTLWPTLREQPADGTPLVLHDVQGVYRLQSSVRTHDVDYSRVETVGAIAFEEFRGGTYGAQS